MVRMVVYIVHGENHMRTFRDSVAPEGGMLCTDLGRTSSGRVAAKVFLDGLVAVFHVAHC